MRVNPTPPHPQEELLFEPSKFEAFPFTSKAFPRCPLEDWVKSLADIGMRYVCLRNLNAQSHQDKKINKHIKSVPCCHAFVTERSSLYSRHFDVVGTVWHRCHLAQRAACRNAFPICSHFFLSCMLTAARFLLQVSQSLQCTATAKTLRVKRSNCTPMLSASRRVTPFSQRPLPGPHGRLFEWKETVPHI